MSIADIPSLKRRRLRKRIRQIFRLGVLVLILAAGLIFINQIFIKEDSAKALITPFAGRGQNHKSLTDVVQTALLDAKGKYAIVIKNLSGGENFSLNEHEVFEAGSLYKLWVMAKAIKNVEAGVLPEDKILSEDVGVLNRIFDIDPNSAEQTEGTITLSVASALNQMITISHNYAALLLVQELRLSSVAAFLREFNFDQSTVGTNGSAPQTTASDVAEFFEKLYKGELASELYSEKMMDLLERQQLNNKLPKYLPEGTVVAHKTGEIGWFSHDGGIVFNPKGDYIIVVLSESESPKGAEERIAEVSKAVFEYFSSN